MNYLAEQLKACDFLNVTGRKEGLYTINTNEKEASWNDNNGTIAIDDGNGSLWIIPSKVFSKITNVRIGVNDCLHLGSFSIQKSSIHVPFSNDGGSFIRSHWRF